MVPGRMGPEEGSTHPDALTPQRGVLIDAIQLNLAHIVQRVQVHIVGIPRSAPSNANRPFESEDGNLALLVIVWIGSPVRWPILQRENQQSRQLDDGGLEVQTFLIDRSCGRRRHEGQDQTTAADPNGR